MKHNPTVSIIMPSFNSERHISESIQSVVGQSFRDWELWVVDDHSTDSTPKILRDFAAMDRRIRPLELPENVGAAKARNRAIQEASGRYIAFLDSDDLWAPEKLSTQVDFMQTRGIPFTYTSYYKVNEQGEVLGRLKAPPFVTYDGLLKTCVIGCLTSVYDTAYFGKVLMPLIKKGQDFALWLSLLKKTERAYGIEEYLAKYRVGASSLSSNKLSSAKYVWKLYRDYEELSFLKSVHCFSHYAVRGLIRTKMPEFSARVGI